MPRLACDAVRRFPAAAVAVGLAVLLSTACNTPQDPGPSPLSSSSSTPSISSPSPSPSPSATESETPEQQDARLAGEAVVKYWAVVDDLAAHPTKSLNHLDPVARDQARAQMQTLLGTYAAKGLVQKGKVSLTDVLASKKARANFTVTACVDVSAVDLVDKSGASQVNPDRPDRQSFSYTVVRANEGFFVTEDTLKGKPC